MPILFNDIGREPRAAHAFGAGARFHPKLGRSGQERDGGSLYLSQRGVGTIVEFHLTGSETIEGNES